MVTAEDMSEFQYNYLPDPSVEDYLYALSMWNESARTPQVPTVHTLAYHNAEALAAADPSFNWLLDLLKQFDHPIQTPLEQRERIAAGVEVLDIFKDGSQRYYQSVASSNLPSVPDDCVLRLVNAHLSFIHDHSYAFGLPDLSRSDATVLGDIWEQYNLSPYFLWKHLQGLTFGPTDQNAEGYRPYVPSSGSEWLIEKLEGSSGRRWVGSRSFPNSNFVMMERGTQGLHFSDSEDRLSIVTPEASERDKGPKLVLTISSLISRSDRKEHASGNDSDPWPPVSFLFRPLLASSPGHASLVNSILSNSINITLPWHWAVICGYTLRADRLQWKYDAMSGNRGQHRESFGTESEQFLATLNTWQNRVGLHIDAVERAQLDARYTSDANKPLQECLRSLNAVRNRLTRIQHQYEQFITRSLSLLSIKEAKKSIQMADSVKRLTVLAMFFLPLAFSSSLLGMNLELLGSGTATIKEFIYTVTGTVGGTLLIAGLLALFYTKTIDWQWYLNKFYYSVLGRRVIRWLFKSGWAGRIGLRPKSW